jgi:hypothetical protein
VEQGAAAPQSALDSAAGALKDEKPRYWLRFSVVQNATDSRLTVRGSDSSKDDGADGKVQRKGRFTVIEVRRKNVPILVCARC